ncbi:MAG: hypothetical protein ACOC55_01895 [Candidatus Natronoplasma sp.]
MTDIGVYTTEEQLEEKKKHAADRSQWVWWDLPSRPSRGLPEKIYFAADGSWKGYFTVEKAEMLPSGGLRVFLDDWHELETEITRTSFQGYTYTVPKEVTA